MPVDTGTLIEGYDEEVRRGLAERLTDAVTASTFLAPGFVMTFPGAVAFTRPEDLTARVKDRYRSIAKSYEKFDETHGPDGTTFEGIRFIDRFTVRDGRIVDQLVWNDLDEVHAKLGRFPQARLLAGTGSASLHDIVLSDGD